VTLSISREIVRAARHLLMAIRRDTRPVDSRFMAGASSAESVSWSLGSTTLRPDPYGKALRIAETTEGSTPSSRKAGRKQIISGSTLRTPTARALT
jgi:hypothetical protein